MRCEFGVADHLGHLPRPPAFIGYLEFGSSPDCEGWYQVETERRGMVVVDEKNDVGSMALYPLFGELIAAENLLPVRFLVPPCIPRGAYGWDVGGIDGGGDPGHGQPFDFRPPAP